MSEKKVENSEEKLKELEKTLTEKFSHEARNKIIISTAMNAIANLTKHVDRAAGRSVVETIIKRDIRNLGKNDAKEIANIMGLKDKSPENIKNVLRIFAALWGMKWAVVEDPQLQEEYPSESPSNFVITECPFNTAAKEHGMPVLCNFCEEYAKGILQELVGEDFTLIPARKMIRGDKYCKYIVVKRY